MMFSDFKNDIIDTMYKAMLSYFKKSVYFQSKHRNPIKSMQSKGQFEGIVQGIMQNKLA